MLNRLSFGENKIYSYLRLDEEVGGGHRPVTSHSPGEKNSQDDSSGELEAISKLYQFSETLCI